MALEIEISLKWCLMRGHIKVDKEWELGVRRKSDTVGNPEEICFGGFEAVDLFHSFKHLMSMKVVVFFALQTFCPIGPEVVRSL